jgi:hypothetical protein
MAMGRLAGAGAPFGFAAATTAQNSGDLGREGLIDEMIRKGCSLRFSTECVPCDPCPNPRRVPEEEARERFRKRVLDLRNQNP